MSLSFSNAKTSYTSTSSLIYSIGFTYENQSEVKVRTQLTSGAYQEVTNWSFLGTTSIQFTSTPPTTFEIYRATDISRSYGTPGYAVFRAGSQLNAGDLNKNFELLRRGIEENNAALSGLLFEDNQYFDDTYVNVTGDKMTGSLVLGTSSSNNTTLAVDGSATFGSKVTTAATTSSDSSTTVTTKSYVDSSVAAVPGTDLAYDSATRVVSSSTGTDATLPEVAAGGDSGLLTGADKTKLDGIASGAQVNVATDLTYTSSSRLLESSTGTDVTLPEVTAAGDSGLMTGADKTKLDGIASGAQVNVATDLAYTSSTRVISSSTGTDATLPEVVAAGDSGLMTGSDKTKLDGIASGAQVNVATDLTYTASTRLLESSTGTDVTLPEVAAAGDSGLMTGADKTKLDGIETNATADQTDAEIKTAYENNADTNAFTDSEKTKLSGIETAATADQTGAEIKALYEVEANAFTDAQFTKLAGIETGATADQTDAEIKTAYENNLDTNAFTDAEKTKLSGIAAGAEVNTVTSVNTATGAVVLDADDIDDASTANKFVTASDVTALGTLSSDLAGKADLSGGKLDTSQLPDIAISEYKGAVANQTAMLAVTGEKGDWVTRSDDGKVYVITGTNTSVIGGWTALSYPASNNTNTDLSYDSSTRVLSSSTGTDATLTEVVAAGASGLMTGADKTKLDGIETGATADQTAAEILTSIKTVDGASSGLDADLLDGQHGSHYLDYSNFSNTPTIPTNNNQLTNGAGYVTSSGNTVIGTDSDINTSGAIVVDQLNMTDGVITSHTTRTMSLNDLGYTGATNANYITNNNQLTNGAGYITSANGGNAATLDNIDSSQFLRSDIADSSSQRIGFQANATNNWDTIATSSGSQGAFEVYNSGSANDAFMAFHTGGDFACYFGLDAGINDIAVGGWSMGAASYRIWHQGNDGSGSGLDADLLDGMQAHTGRNDQANQIVRTDASGYINAGWINTTSGSTTNTIDKVFSSYSGDNYMRYCTPNHLANSMSNVVKTTYNSSLNSDSRNSRGVTRLYRRDNDSDYSVQTWWTGTYWRLYGYNGDSGHGDTHCGYANNAGGVDGIDSSQFLRSDTADQKTSGTLRFNDNVILSLGTGDDAEFFCNGSHLYLDLNSGIGNFYIRDGTTTRFTFDDAGHFTATGNMYSNGNLVYHRGNIATQSEAQAGTNNTQIMTPLRVAQAIAALGGGGSVINSIQRFIGQLGWPSLTWDSSIGLYYTNITISSVNMSNTMVNHVGQLDNHGNDSAYGVIARLTSSTNLRLYRRINSSSYTTYYSVEVIEFA